MAVKNQHLILARKFLSLLTWRKILSVFVILLVSAVIIFSWLYRSDVYTNVLVMSNEPALRISLPVKNEIDSIVIKSPLIVSIQVITINFQYNIQIDSYTSIDDMKFRQIYDDYLKNKVFETPLFGDSKETNRRLLRLISGEFVCSPFKETIGYSRTPQLGSVVTDICSMAIPPYHGDFSGILNIYLSNHPTKDDTERLFLLSRDISIKVYEENKYARENKR